MTVHPFSREDLDRVSQLEERAGDVKWSRAQFEKELSLPMSRFFVLKEGANILGYGGYWKVTEEAQLTNLFVTPDERRNGKGELLLRYLLENARAEGCRTMTLEVRGGNLAAQGLYQKAGFSIQTRRANAYTNPPDEAVLMENTL